MSMSGTWGYGGTRCRIKRGRDGAGREGDAICFFDHDRLGQEWIVVLWDDEEDPDCFKSAGLEIKRLGETVFRAVGDEGEMNTIQNWKQLLIELAKCEPGTGLILVPSKTKGYRYCMSQGFIERLGVPGIVEVTRLTSKGRKMAREARP